MPPSARVSEACKDLVKGLLTVTVTKRLGVGQNGYARLRSHAFFAGARGAEDATLPPP
jgi:hypothetical protein